MCAATAGREGQKGVGTARRTPPRCSGGGLVCCVKKRCAAAASSYRRRMRRGTFDINGIIKEKKKETNTFRI